MLVALAMASAAELAAASAAADFAGEPREIVLHRLEFRDLLLERDALVGIAHGDVEHRFQRAGDLQAARDAAHHSISGSGRNLSARGLIASGCDFVERHGVAVVAAEVEAGLDPAALVASTSAIEMPPLASSASTAMCLAALANGTPRARPDSVPSALSVMRSCGLGGRDRHLAVGRGDLAPAPAASPPAWFRPAAPRRQNARRRSAR